MKFTDFPFPLLKRKFLSKMYVESKFLIMISPQRMQNPGCEVQLIQGACH